MELTFTLPNGTRAGIVPTAGRGDRTGQQPGLARLAPAQDAAVVFYAPNKEAVDRILARFAEKGAAR